MSRLYRTGTGRCERARSLVFRDMTPTLRTPRLVLRPLSAADAGAIQTLFPDWEVVKWLTAHVPWPYPANGAATFLSTVLPAVERGERFVWAITEASDPAHPLIGIIDLFPFAEHDHRGFWLGHPYQRRGYMTEAVVAVTDFAFDVLERPFLLLNNSEPNLASHRLKEKSGAEILGYQDDVAYVSGRFRSVQWRLTPEAWRAHRAGLLPASE